jgi:adenylate cyclase
MFNLRFSAGARSQPFALSNRTTVAGRSPDCELSIADSSVSRLHARFDLNGDDCVLTDLDSRNGTYVNGQKINQISLRDGDLIRLGEVELQFSVLCDPGEADVDAVLDGPGTVYRSVDDVGPTIAAVPMRTFVTDLGRLFVERADEQNVLENVVSLVFKHLAADRVALLLLDKGGALHERISRTRSGETAVEGVSRTVVSKVVHDRVALCAPLAALDTRLKQAPSVCAGGIGGLMCAPLWTEQAITGVLYVDTSSSDALTPEHLELLLVLAGCAAVAIEQSQLQNRLREEERRRERLARYHSPDVVTRILRQDVEVNAELAAEECDASILFVDVVGFTTLSERLAPSELAGKLNEFFAVMVDTIFNYAGTLDKFIGDGLLAVFGAPLDQPDHALAAARCAVDMFRALDVLNEKRGTRWQIRAAIATGKVIAGDIGSPRRRDYTVLGDVVNTASRLESEVARAGQAVVTRATADAIAGRLRCSPLGNFALRGRVEPVEAFELDTGASSSVAVVPSP